MTRSFFTLLALLVLPVLMPLWADAQTASLTTREPRIQIGPGVIPGIGIQGAYVAPRNIYTRELSLYVDVTPSFAEGEGSVQVATALGGALRLIGIWRTIGNAGSRRYDLDVGLRFGPALTFAFNETKENKNKRFSLSQDPYVRFTSLFRERRIFFVELGAQRPILRAGLWFTL